MAPRIDEAQDRDVKGDAVAGRIATFFFQAEDGIRDRCVTGVQRCALPISTAGNTGLGLALVAAQVEHLLLAHLVRNHEHEAVALPRGHEREAEPGVAGGRPDERRARGSEERRVGEEGRTRGGPDHLKKKKRRFRGTGMLCCEVRSILTLVPLRHLLHMLQAYRQRNAGVVSNGYYTTNVCVSALHVMLAQ